MLVLFLSHCRGQGFDSPRLHHDPFSFLIEPCRPGTDCAVPGLSSSCRWWGCRFAAAREPASHLQHRSRTPEQDQRSDEHTSELQSLMRISYAVFCLKKTKH